MSSSLEQSAVVTVISVGFISFCCEVAKLIDASSNAVSPSPGAISPLRAEKGKINDIKAPST